MPQLKTLVPLLALLLCAWAPNDEALWQHRNLGKAFYENPTTHAEAVAELKKALALDPQSARERLNYGLALLRVARTQEAMTELLAVQKQAPELPHTWFNLGIAYKKSRQYPQAIAQLQQFVKLVPDDPIAHYNLGFIYRLQEHIPEALKEFQIAARLNPDLPAPLFQIYNIYRESDQVAPAEKALKEFRDAKQRREDPDSNDDMEWNSYAEVYDPVDAPGPDAAPKAALRFSDRVLAGPANAAGLLALDYDGDGKPDLLAWSAAGVMLYRAGAEAVTDSGLAALRGAISVSAGDYDNDGLPDLCVLTTTGPLLFHNQKGHFSRANAVLPAGRFERALWVDYDHDYDLDLMLLGEHAVLLRNQGAAGFADHTRDFPFAAGHALDAAVFHRLTDNKSADIVISYRDHAGVIYHDRLLARYDAEALAALPAGTVGLLPVDFDNDGWMDIAFGGGLLRNRQGVLEAGLPAGGTAAADLENRGMPDLLAGGVAHGFAPGGKFQDRALPLAATTWVAADFNGDGREDLAGITSDGKVHLLLNETAGAQHWTQVRLSGVKNLKSGVNAEVEVKSGPVYQKKLYQGAPLHFGLRGQAGIDTVRITWPNGMVQNATAQPADRALALVEAPRLSGSCPMIFSWNGTRFEFVTDVLGVAPLGASSGDGSFFPTDHDEYVQIPAGMLAERNGRYDLRITEELSEVSYLDQVRLIAVDHPREVEIFSNDKWKSPPYPEFRLFGVRRRVYPRAAEAVAGPRREDVRDRLLRLDHTYAGGFRRSPAGVAEMHALELDFGPQAAPSNRAVLVLNGWVDWADGSTFLASAQEGRGGLVPPYLQVKDAAGRWRTVIRDMGMPSGKTKTIAVDLTGKFLSGSRQVRIVTNLCVYWDEIFLGEDSGAPPVRLTALDAGSADLHFRGFSRAAIDPLRRQPEWFDYARVSPVSQWNPTPGMYTRYGPVEALVRAADDRMVVMGSGDELRLSYDAASLPRLPQGWRRDFLLLVDGWAKDRDANTAYSQTVEPLPFHSMSGYPYPAREHFPHPEYQKVYNYRPALRLLPELSAR